MGCADRPPGLKSIRSLPKKDRPTLIDIPQKIKEGENSFPRSFLFDISSSVCCAEIDARGEYLVEFSAPENLQEAKPTSKQMKIVDFITEAK